MSRLNRKVVRAKKPGFAQFAIRKARPRDKGPIVEITRKIWGGHDYVPAVWEDWLKSRRGELLVGTIKGIPIAVAHGYLQTRDVAWLEGVRVHEQYRGLGIAGKLNMALTHWARSKGARVARLCTGTSNVASVKHLAKTRFRVLQTFQRLESTRKLQTKPVGVTRPRRQSRHFWNWLSSRPEFVENRAMYSDGWTWYPLTRTAFENYLETGKVLMTVNDGTPTSCCIFLDDDRRLTLGFAAGEPKDVAKLMKMLRFMLSRKKYDKVRVLLPRGSPLVAVARRSGFRNTSRILTYERFLG